MYFPWIILGSGSVAQLTHDDCFHVEILKALTTAKSAVPAFTELLEMLIINKKYPRTVLLQQHVQPGHAAKAWSRGAKVSLEMLSPANTCLPTYHPSTLGNRDRDDESTLDLLPKMTEQCFFASPSFVVVCVLATSRWDSWGGYPRCEYRITITKSLTLLVV